MIDQITQPEWVSAKRETRQKLREIFNVPSTGYTQTVTDTGGIGIVISDGSTHEDLKVITVEKLREFTGIEGTDDSIHTLFVRAVDLIENPPQERKVFEIYQTPTAQITEEPKVQEVVLETEDKCAKCEFRTASRAAMKMHFGKFHKDYN